MTRNTYITSAVAGLVLAGGLAGAVSAQEAASATGLSEEQIIEIALAEVPGEVLEVEMEHEDGQHVFEVEIETETGEEAEVVIAAASGEVLEVAMEDDDKDCDKDDDDDDDDKDGDDKDATDDA